MYGHPNFHKRKNLRRRPPAARALYMRRLEYGYTLRELSDKTGIDVAMLSRYESGARRPSAETLARIEQAYK